MSNEIKIGDTVDCSGWERDNLSPMRDGKVYDGPDDNGYWFVYGLWMGKTEGFWVRPDQITRHVPAAPVVERPKSCGDKLASEMTFREETIKAVLAGFAAAPDAGGTIEGAAEYAIKWADTLIAALDKERE